MKKALPTLLVMMILPATANAGTPQQELYSHLVRQAGKSGECRGAAVSDRYCNPARVTGSAKDATQVLRFIRNVEMLGIACSGGDVNACLRQGAIRTEAEKLGWCARPTRGLNWENVILWARCAQAVIYEPNK